MLSHCSTNRKRSRSALSNIANVNHHQNNNNNNKRIKLGNQSQQQVIVNSHWSDCFTVNLRPLQLNHLPFDCLSWIFSRISLQHRITRLSMVCGHWKSTVDEMCRIKGQLTINLFSNYKPRVTELTTNDLEHYWTNVRHERMESLLVSNRNCPIPNLSLRFPLVTQLVIRSNDTTERQNRASLQLFSGLLRGQPKEWCSSLTSLTLYKTTKITDPTYLPEICSMINRRSSNLTNLNIYLQSFGPVTRQTYHPERVKLHNVLPQLERFFVTCPFANWTSVVRTVSDRTKRRTSSGVKEFNIQLECSLSFENWTALLAQTQLTSTVTHFHLLSISSQRWFRLICESFSLVQFLQIEVGNNKFDADWFSDLRKLKHLTELKMHHFKLDPTVKAVPLPTIKKLTICEPNLLSHFRASTNSNRFNASHYCRLLSQHFPSVSVLILLSNEKSVKMAERTICKWAKVHFKHIHKLVLVLKAVEYRNEMNWRRKFMREYLKLSRN